MRSVSRNVLANFGGHFWIVALNLAVVPLYLPLVGVEAYGLVGFYSALLAVFSVLDSGLGLGATREIAIRSATPDAGSIRQLIRSLEWIYWPVALAAGGFCVSLTPWLALSWFSPQHLSHDTLATCLALLGASIAFRFPAGLYSGVLTGLQCQPVINFIRVGYSTLSNLGALLILTFIWSAPEAFFSWQLFTSILNVAVLAYFAWRNSPPAEKEVRFQGFEISNLAGFATGNAINSILVLILTQTDRLVLSALVPLAQFGIYTLAANLNAGLAGLSSNVTSVLFPKFAQLAGTGDQVQIAQFLHRAAQFTALVMIPLCFSVIAVMDILLSFWLRDQSVAMIAITPARLLIAGTVFNALVSVPYALVLGSGNTKFGVLQNIVSASLLIPLLWILIPRFGVNGAAAGWLFLNLGYYLISGLFMFKISLPAEMVRWYLDDTGVPFLISGSVYGLFISWSAWFHPLPIVRLGLVVLITLALVSGFIFRVQWMREIARTRIEALLLLRANY